MVTIAQLIDRIEKRQPVLNKVALSAEQLQTAVVGVNPLDKAAADQLSFLANARYKAALATTCAGAVLVEQANSEQVPPSTVALVVGSPYLAYASSSQLFEPQLTQEQMATLQSAANVVADATESQIHPTACIHPTAVIGANVSIAAGVIIGPFCVIESGCSIGAGSKLTSHVSLAPHVTLGPDCHLFPQVTIGHNCQLGERVRVQAQASIGMAGFGFAPTADPATSGWERIAQLGRVIIGNDVRIGSQTCIDRGAVEDTVIGDHVIIDNLVQIAHNVRIGAGTAIAANTGIAGSTTIGKRCIIGGAVGIVGHLEIADDVTLTAMTMVTKSLTESGSYSSGTVAMPTSKWRRAAVRFRQVD